MQHIQKNLERVWLENIKKNNLWDLTLDGDRTELDGSRNAANLLNW